MADGIRCHCHGQPERISLRGILLVYQALRQACLAPGSGTEWPHTVSAALYRHVSLNCNMTETLVLPATGSVHAFQLLVAHAAHNMVKCQETHAVNPDSPAHAADDEIVCVVYIDTVYTEYPLESHTADMQ